ncbi:MAG: polysaccharide deacetylase family protein [Alphaproteobacteria bacterium]|nr:polysaccharide deacetylase family protein [Alphaproteobacteria bacterium]
MPKAAIFKTSLDVLYYSGASAALQKVFAGIGAIFMLHHVFPGGGLQRGFAPNAGIELTPEFLDDVITHVRERGFDLISFDAAVERIRAGDRGERPFAVFTLDDGYRDNLVHAAPVFRKHNCPYTVFVAPAITDGTCELWWRGLEHVLLATDYMVAEIDGARFELPTATAQQKQEAWSRLYWPIRRQEQHAQRKWIAEVCERHGVDLGKMCADAAMAWDEVRTMAADPLCTIGAHTINHFAVGQLDAEEALGEMVASAERIEKELGRRPEFFAYPYGDRDSAGPRDFALAAEAGFRAAVTTRKGLIYPGHRNHLQALPRLSLSGSYQRLRFVKTLLTGVPFALFNKMQKVDVS